MACHVALRRLMSEYKQLTISPPEGIVAGPPDEENFFLWEVALAGPEESAYEGGVFSATLSFPPDYPLLPPVLRFTSDMFHPNIYPDGTVCVSLLHPPDEDVFGYEKLADRWSPTRTVEKILLSVVLLLAEPNAESPANVDAAKMWREDRAQYNALVAETVRKSLGL
ncbi:Ubiquitin-conjugating enzyme E2 G2 [Tyrophagus putrescentiae]|nr:Ubiquitin-conjugating enzyme E2 G2 [Tyrophagus putrescentiae]